MKRSKKRESGIREKKFYRDYLFLNPKDKPA